MSQRFPIVVVLGATACGKSKLAIDIAKRFAGEIISADSMQVYHGLDIVTNKVSEQEQAEAKHHMIDFLDPLTRYSIIDFKEKSLDIIEQLHERHSLPIIVGGTNYYIESLLWKNFSIGSRVAAEKRLHQDHLNDIPSEDPNKSGTIIDEEFQALKKSTPESLHSEEDFESIDKFFKKRIFNDAFKKTDSKKLWDILEQVDPSSAHRFHPNDKRKIIRMLQIIQERNYSYSDILEDVNKSSKETKISLGGPLRFENTMVIWLDCDPDVLDKVLDERVDRMVELGLLSELEKFHNDYNKKRLTIGEEPDYTKGIFQTIGFKEFHNYLLLDTEIKSTEKGKKILAQSINEMKLSTRRYAKKQLKWIRRRFLQSDLRDLPKVFRLTTTFDENSWATQVRQPAISLVDSLINDKVISEELNKFRQQPTIRLELNDPGKYHCETCDRTFIGTYYIKSHLNSKGHNRKVQQLKHKRQKLDENSWFTKLSNWLIWK